MTGFVEHRSVGLDSVWREDVSPANSSFLPLVVQAFLVQFLLMLDALQPIEYFPYCFLVSQSMPGDSGNFVTAAECKKCSGSKLIVRVLFGWLLSLGLASCSCSSDMNFCILTSRLLEICDHTA